MRFNPPPNWPSPPAGWTPPQGWQPDPAWGPAPPDWQFWLPDPDPAPVPATAPVLTPAAVPAPTPAPAPARGPADLDPPVPPPLPGFTMDDVPSAAAPAWPAAASTQPLLPAAGPVRRRRNLKVVLPVTAVLVAGLAGGGVYGTQAWQDHQEQVRLDQAHQRLRADYAAGHAAFLTGDCATAVPRFDRVKEAVLEPDLTDKSATERAACAKLQVTRDAAGKPADKVVAYLDYVAGGPGAPLQPIATRELVALYTGTPAAQLVSDQLCNRVEAVGSTVLTTDAARAKGLPGLLLRCADLAAKSGDPAVAEDGYRQIREEYAKSPEAAPATAALAKIIVADGKKTGRKLSAPFPRRDGSLGDGEVKLVVYNGTPYDLQVAVTGPTAAIGAADACSTCKVFSSRASATCAFKGKRATITLPAGKYAVDIRFPDQPDTPSIGTWTLRAGNSYEGCFYVAKK